MPEIPEVEKLRSQLAPAWTGRSIVKWTAPPDSPNPKKYFQGEWPHLRRMTSQPCQGVHRLGKAIGLMFPSEEFLHIHLNSTGWWMPGNELAARSTEIDRIVENFLHKINPRNVRVRAHFDDGQIWWYHDGRTWGKWYPRVGSSMRDDPYFKGYGPDWFQEPLKAQDRLVSNRSRRTTKDVLTDQKVTAGIGNYLAVEACFLACIHPHKRYDEVTTEERQILADKLLEFIELSFRKYDHEHWHVFGRTGQPCPRHPAASIRYVKDSGESRGSYFCPICQPLETE